MLPKEIVLRAIEYRNPPRIPVHYCNRDLDSSDTFTVGWNPDNDFTANQQGQSEWGFIWHSLDKTMGQPESHPLADWDKIVAYIPPDPFAHGRLDHVAVALAQNADRFTRFGIGISGFNIATFLRGFEAFLMDLYLAPERAERVLDMVYASENGLIAQLENLPADCVVFGDDWGTQRGLMIQPGIFRRVFLPRYADQFARIHAQGKKVWFHTCGNVWDIIGDMITAGVDVIELLQPDIFGVERLAATFGGKVCFCCSVDHQRRAVSGTRDEIFDYTRLLRDQLGRYNGGFIGYVEDYASLGMTEQNYQWIRQAFHSLDVPQPSALA